MRTWADVTNLKTKETICVPFKELGYSSGDLLYVAIQLGESGVYEPFLQYKTPYVISLKEENKDITCKIYSCRVSDNLQFNPGKYVVYEVITNMDAIKLL